MDTENRPLANATVSLSRATLTAAIITLIGTILGAVIGNRHGEQMSAVADFEGRQTKTLPSQSAQQSEESVGRDSEIRLLKEQLANSERQVAALTRELREVKTTSIPQPSQHLVSGDFSFDLQSCIRRGDLVRCSIIVTNDSDKLLEINLCLSIIVSPTGEKPQTTTEFSGGGCEIMRAVPGIPNALQLSAITPASVVNIVLSGGRGSLTFRNVHIET
jgi:hypothetical protein